YNDKFRHINKLTFTELENIILSLSNINSEVFLDGLKFCLTYDYCKGGKVLKRKEVFEKTVIYQTTGGNELDYEKKNYNLKKKNGNKNNDHILQANIYVINFLFFKNILTKLTHYICFEFFKKIDLLKLVKNVIIPKSKLEFYEDDILFDCLVKHDVFFYAEAGAGEEVDDNHYME
ncbi:conserved protein, unknown function, partial [Hepatocystis sp. ex Piliocolobus tephrosceles]